MESPVAWWLVWSSLPKIFFLISGSTMSWPAPQGYIIWINFTAAIKAQRLSSCQKSFVLCLSVLALFKPCAWLTRMPYQSGFIVRHLTHSSKSSTPPEEDLLLLVRCSVAANPDLVALAVLVGALNLLTKICNKSESNCRSTLIQKCENMIYFFFKNFFKIC